MSIILLLLSLATHIACQQFSFPPAASPVRPPSLQVDGSGNVFASTGHHLYQLNSSLALEQRRNLSSEAASIALGTDGSWLVACMTDLSCEIYSAANLSAQPILRRENAIKSAENLALFAAEDSFYVGSISTKSLAQSQIHLGQYNVLSGTAQGNSYDITLHNFERNFFGGFVQGNYAYYFVTDNNPVEVRDIRVMRVCHNSNFRALYELTLRCGGRTPSADTRLSGVTLTEGVDGSVVTLSRSRPRSSQNYVCLYNVSMIDSIMQRKFNTCTAASSGSTEQFDLAWKSLTSFCNEFQPSQNNCQFETSGPLALDDIETLHLNGRFQINLGQAFITASIAVTVDAFSFTFVAATSTNGSSFIYGFFDTGGTDHILSESSYFYRRVVEAPVVQLKWHNGLNFIYAATESGVIKLPITDCGSYNTCDSCLEGVNPLCGWCLLENRCSRNRDCQAFEHRWIQANTLTSMECLTIYAVNPTELFTDNPQTVEIHLSQRLPLLLSNETYQCYFSNDEITFQVEASGTNTTNISCDMRDTMAPLPYKSIATVVSVSVSSSTLGIPFVTLSSSITIYDCTLATNCGQCVNSACGWCVLNKLCSGTPNSCIRGVEGYLQDTLQSQTISDLCPLLDEPSPGKHYSYPVRTKRNIDLVTRNLPPEIDGFSYKCQIKGIEFPAMYNNGSSLTCLLQNGELSLEQGVSQEAADITIVWLGNHQGQYIVHKIDSFANVSVILYSCAELADCCSTCLFHAINNGFECGWCERPGIAMAADGCVYIGDCNSTSVTERQNCPAPVILDFNPKSGPPEGGTTITIIGRDLGVTSEEYDFNNIKVGIDCLPIGSNFIPGRQILCSTTNSELATPGTYPVTVILPSGFASAETMFELVIPEIHGVFPPIGPMAGGTTLTVLGSNLNIGNTENTSITLVNGIKCNVTSIQEFSITCDTMPLTGIDAPTTDLVNVSIDLALILNESVQFTYFPNPQITNVEPSSTIPAGGITLLFYGIHMDVVQYPIFVVNGLDYHSTMTKCTTLNSSAIACVTPPLTRLQQGDEDRLNYTIIMDNAPGPDLSMERLQISVLPNPGNFILVTTDVRDLINGSIIQISGENLPSVPATEIEVDIGGEACVITAVEPHKGQLFCTPPMQRPGGATRPNVTVSIGIHLNYTLSNTLNYNTVETIDSGSTIVYAAVLPFLILVVSLVIIIFILVLAWVLYRRAKVDKGRDHEDSMECRYENSFSQFSPPTTPRRHSSPPSSLQTTLQSPLEQLRVSQKLIIPGRLLQILNKKIGHGEFGDVYVAQLMKWHGKRKKMTVAVKTLKFIHTVSDRAKMIAEINKMENLRHPNVMPLLGVCLDAGNVISIVLPFMANGSLLSYLKKQRPKLYLKNNAKTTHVMSVNKLLLRLCHQVAKGMEYLVTQNVVHRDLAARNCLLDGQGNVRVGDFGLAEDIYTRGYFRQSKSEAVKLPFKWMAPESLRDGLFSEKSDVWSFGITCWEVFSGGRIPYSAVDAISILSLHEKGTRLERPANQACAAEDYSIMVKCWALEPEDRPNFNQLRSNIDELLQTAAGYLELKMVLVPPKDEECMDDSGYEIAENPFKDEFESLTISNPLAMENDADISTTSRQIPVRFAKLSIDASRDISDYRVKVSSLTRNHSSIW